MKKAAWNESEKMNLPQSLRTTYDDIYINVTEDLHGSGYRIMIVMGGTKEGPTEIISECCDALHMNVTKCKMDVTPEGLLHYYACQGQERQLFFGYINCPRPFKVNGRHSDVTISVGDSVQD